MLVENKVAHIDDTCLMSIEAVQFQPSIEHVPIWSSTESNNLTNAPPRSLQFCRMDVLR